MPNLRDVLANSKTERKDVQLSLKVLEIVAKYEETLRHPQTESTPDDNEDRERLRAEYFVLRTALVSIILPSSHS
jgi:hypothetical protein